MERLKLMICAAFLVMAGCATADGIKGSGPGMEMRDQPGLQRQTGNIARSLLEKIQSTRAKSLRIAVTEIVPMSGDPAGSLENAILEYLQNALQREGAKVMERSRLNKALAELHLSASDLFEGRADPKAGRLMGLDALLTGTTYADPSGGYRLNIRIVDVETGAVLAMEAFTIPLSDEVRRLTATNVPGSIRINAPAGTRITIDHTEYTLDHSGQVFDVASGTHQVGVSLEGLAGQTTVSVGERETVTVTPRAQHDKSRVADTVVWNALVPGITWGQRNGALVILPAVGFYTSLIVTLTDLGNDPHGFFTKEQEARYDRAQSANMVYDYGALTGFYGLTLVGAYVQGNLMSAGKGTVHWSFTPIANGHTTGLAFNYVP